jgi:hypothetical protein
MDGVWPDACQDDLSIALVARIRSWRSANPQAGFAEVELKLDDCVRRVRALVREDGG